MLVPLYIIVAGFDPKVAVALSNVTIFGSAISNVALAASRRHPHHDKPLIDWSLIMIMEPPVIAGAVVGSLINKLLPSLVVTIFLVLTLSFMAKRTMTKGLKLWREEGGWQGVFGRGHTLGGGLPTQQAGVVAGEARGLLAGGSQGQGAKKYGGATLAELDEDAVRRVGLGGAVCVQMARTTRGARSDRPAFTNDSYTPQNPTHPTDPGQGAPRAALAAAPPRRLLRGHGAPPNPEERHRVRFHRLLGPRPRRPALVRTFL